MLILQAFLLWLVVSTLVVGGAMLFHRRFPEESPWLGFLVPPLAFVVLMNFIEHLFPLPSLLALLPVFLLGTLWMVARGRYFTRALVLPTVIFLASFAFTFAFRCVTPNIDFTSDGISDLNMVNTYSQGGTLPPTDTWLPPYPFEWYYGLQHYAASILGRLIDVKVGIATNVSHALLSALTCVVGAGVAWRVSGGKIWVTALIPILIESAMTGTSAYIELTAKDPSVWLASDLNGIMPTEAAPTVSLAPDTYNPLWRLLNAHSHFGAFRLQTPGFWTWRSEYHANAGGHFLTLLALLAVVELALPRRTLWPWILAVMVPLLAVIGSAWALPITALLAWGFLPIAWFCGRRPIYLPHAIIALGTGIVLIWPAFYNATSSPQPPEILRLVKEDYVPWFEYLVQWWPILTLWICAFVCFWRLSFALRWVLLVVPVMLLGIDLVNIESRYNMIEKMWGYTWGVALIGFFPLVASLKGIGYRIVTIILMLSASISLFAHMRSELRWSPKSAYFHLEGNSYILDNEQKRKMYQIVAQQKKKTYLSGKAIWCYNEAPTLATFTGNRSYIAWFHYEELVNLYAEVHDRVAKNNDFYEKAGNRLRFLQGNNIYGVLIWPDDNIPDETLNQMKADLDAAYDYRDCKGNGEKNAGVFVLRGQSQS